MVGWVRLRHALSGHTTENTLNIWLFIISLTLLFILILLLNDILPKDISIRYLVATKGHPWSVAHFRRLGLLKILRPILRQLMESLLHLRILGKSWDRLCCVINNLFHSRVCTDKRLARAPVCRWNITHALDDLLGQLLPMDWVYLIQVVQLTIDELFYLLVGHLL